MHRGSCNRAWPTTAERSSPPARHKPARSARRSPSSAAAVATCVVEFLCLRDPALDQGTQAASTPTPTRPHLGGGRRMEPPVGAAYKEFLPPRWGKVRKG